MDGLSWKTLLKWMIWGYPYFWKHPCDFETDDFETYDVSALSFIFEVILELLCTQVENM